MRRFVYIRDRPASPETLCDTIKIVDLSPRAGAPETIAVAWDRRVAERIVESLNLFIGDFSEEAGSALP